MDIVSLEEWVLVLKGGRQTAKHIPLKFVNFPHKREFLRSHLAFYF